MATFGGSFPKFKISKTYDTVGPFALGASLLSVFAYLRKNQSQYPNNAFYFNQVDPMSMDYVIELSSFGVSLRFNPILQILTSIRFSKMDEVVLQYPMGIAGQVSTFSQPKKVATVGEVYHVFGPTTPGKYENHFRHFVLEYPGLAFVFEVPNDKSDLYTRDASAVPQVEDQMPNMSLPLVALYCRPSEKSAQITTREDAIRELDRRPYVEVNRGQSITFYYPSSGTSTTIDFGTHLQEVISSLGLPNQRFTKPPSAFGSSKASAHANALLQSTVLPEPDYFFNYFDFGVDILFDGKLHVAKKFILWTNLPSQPNFVRYAKCHFRIETRGIPSSRSSSSSNIRSSAQIIAPPSDLLDLSAPLNQNHAREGAMGRPAQEEEDEQPERIGVAPIPARPLVSSDFSLIPDLITPQMKWPAIEGILGPPTGSPHWFPGREGAFGGMTYFAYPNIIFEVMKKDEYVSKIFLFPD